MAKILKPQFFHRPTQRVAKDLLGKFIVRRFHGKITALMITEVEAYDGPNDKASHAHRGETERNKIMFGIAGQWYVYFTYGVHWMLNISVGPAGYPAAVLIRGTDKIVGPARLTKFLQIDKKLNNQPAVRSSGLWLEDRGVIVKNRQIQRTPRIGIDSSGPVWSKKLYRYILKY